VSPFLSFLVVCQGDVESIAAKSASDLSALVETTSGSGRLKDAYEEARKEVELREEDFTKSFEQKRFVVKERHQLKAQKEEAEQYQEAQAGYTASKVNLVLFQLFHLQHDIDTKTAEADRQAKEHAKEFKQLLELQESMQAVSADSARLRKEQQVADKHLSKSSGVLEKRRPGQVALRQEIAHLNKNVANEKKKLDTAVADAAQHTKHTRALEKELAAVQAQLDELRAAMEAEDEESKKLKLAAAQLTEYNELKQRAALDTAELTARIKSAQHDQRAASEAAESVRVVLDAMRVRLELNEKTRGEQQQGLARTSDLVAQTKETIKQHQKELAEMKAKAAAAKSDTRAGRQAGWGRRCTLAGS